MLVVPDIHKNLLSVSQLTSEYPYNFEFSSKGFVIKNKNTRTLIASRIRSGNLYAFQPDMHKAMFSTESRVINNETWHQWLGHPHMQGVDFLRRNKLISTISSNKATNVCSSCQIAKSCRLPFLLSETFVDKPLIKFHIDLWGLAPVFSCQCFRFYVIFVDECTRFNMVLPFET